MKRYLKFIVKISLLNFIVLIIGLTFLGQNPTTPSPVITIPNQTPAPTTSPGLTPNPKTPTSTNSRVQPTTQPIIDLFTEVPKHNSSNDCWFIINGHVYDVTSYFGAHPGGDSIMLKYCGQDATSAFNTRGQSESSHSNTAISLLAEYMIK